MSVRAAANREKNSSRSPLVLAPLRGSTTIKVKSRRSRATLFRSSRDEHACTFNDASSHASHNRRTSSWVSILWSGGSAKVGWTIRSSCVGIARDDVSSPKALVQEDAHALGSGKGKKPAKAISCTT